MGVLQDVGVSTGKVTTRVDVTAVSTVEACEALHVGHCPVVEHRAIHGLVDDALSGDGQREAHGDNVVHGERGLPYLWHVEVGVNRTD